MADSQSPPRQRGSHRRDDSPPTRRQHSSDRKRYRSRSRDRDNDRHKPRYQSPRPRSREEHTHDRRDCDDHKRRRRRSRSTEEEHSRRHRRQRSLSAEADPNDSFRHGKRSSDKQLVRSRRERSSSRDRYRRRDRRPGSISQSPPPSAAARKSHRQSLSPPTRRARGPLPSQQDAYTSKDGAINGKGGPGAVEKQKPNYGTSGKLAAETNTVSIGGEAIVLKYHEPAEARKPPSGQAWRMYEFKGDNPDPLSTVELAVRSCWLFGREAAVVDFLIEHPSCSKQHAVLQFRHVERRNEFGDKIGGVKPYVLDLESANGTSVNGERIADRRYVEVKSGDSISFGESTREYVVLLPPKEKVASAMEN